MFIGLLCGGLSLSLISIFPNQNQANVVAILFILAQLSMALLDISAHSIMIKEIASKSQNSIIIGYGQTLGALIGGLILLKFTSKQFAAMIGLSRPLASFSGFFLVTGLLAVIPALIFHFIYKETVLTSEKYCAGFGFFKTISYYRVCLQPASKYFRIAIFFLISNQGLNFFLATYDYQLMKAGFSRDTYNTLSNVLAIPVIICTFFLSKFTNCLGGKRNSLIFTFGVTIAIDIYTTIVFPLNIWFITTTSLIIGIFDAWRFYTTAYMVNQFPPNALTGMFITFLTSCSNFGKITSVHTWIIGKLGWKLCFLVGLGIQIIIVMCIPAFFEWINAGNVHVPK